MTAGLIALGWAAGPAPFISRLLPLDWDEARVSDETVKDIHQVAERYGIGRHGISIPIRELGVGDAMFSINFDCDDRHWGEVRRELVNEVHLFAHYYHQRVKKLIAAQQRPMGEGFELSRRPVARWKSRAATTAGRGR